MATGAGVSSACVAEGVGHEERVGERDERRVEPQRVQLGGGKLIRQNVGQAFDGDSGQ